MPDNRELETKLMRGIRREIKRLLAVDVHKDLPGDRIEAGLLRVAVADAQKGIVAADFDKFLGAELGSTARRAVHRMAERLEQAGKLRRLRRGVSGERITHLQLVEPVGA